MATVQPYSRYNTRIIFDGSTLAEHTDTDVAGAGIGDLMYLNSTAEWEKTAGLLKWDGLQLRVSGDLVLQEKAAPATPASGFGAFYAGTDDRPHYINDAGASIDIGLPTASVEGEMLHNVGNVWTATGNRLMFRHQITPFTTGTLLHINGATSGSAYTAYSINEVVLGLVGYVDSSSILQMYASTGDLHFNTVSATIPSLAIMSTGHARLREYGTPGDPGAANGYLYIDSADSKLKFKNDALTVFDLTDTGSPPPSTLDDLTDVDLTGALDNDLFFRVSSNWEPTKGKLIWNGSGALTVGNATDTTAQVNVKSPTGTGFADLTLFAGSSFGRIRYTDTGGKSMQVAAGHSKLSFMTDSAGSPVERAYIDTSGNIFLGLVTADVTIAASGGKVGFYAGTPIVKPTAYTMNTVVVTDKTLLASASATTLNNNNVLAALITDLQALNLIG